MNDFSLKDLRIPIKFFNILKKNEEKTCWDKNTANIGSIHDCVISVYSFSLCICVDIVYKKKVVTKVVMLFCEVIYIIDSSKTYNSWTLDYDTGT